MIKESLIQAHFKYSKRPHKLHVNFKLYIFGFYPRLEVNLFYGSFYHNQLIK